MTDFVKIDDVAYPVRTDLECDIAYAAMRAAGIRTTPLLCGDPDDPRQAPSASTFSLPDPDDGDDGWAPAGFDGSDDFWDLDADSDYYDDYDGWDRDDEDDWQACDADDPSEQSLSWSHLVDLAAGPQPCPRCGERSTLTASQIAAGVRCCVPLRQSEGQQP